MRVGWAEAVDAQYALVALGELIKRGASHCTKANDDHLIVRYHGFILGDVLRAVEAKEIWFGFVGDSCYPLILWLMCDYLFRLFFSRYH